jgi:hypothetical protein
LLVIVGRAQFPGLARSFVNSSRAKAAVHRQGVGELDQDKLGDLLQLKYRSVPDAIDQLGDVPAIRDTFVGFQQYLY